MEDKMTAEQEKEIKGLREEVRALEKQINEKKVEIDRMLIKAGANFEGSYVEFFNGEEYIFMKVERQIIRANDTKINLQGPAIRLDDSPLSKDYNEDDVFSSVFYDEDDGFSFGAMVLEGHTVERIRKIRKKDMAFVLDYYINTLKKKLI